MREGEQRGAEALAGEWRGSSHLDERALEHHASHVVGDVARDDVKGERLQPLQRADGDREDEVEEHLVRRVGGA